MARLFFICGALCGCLAVALGAYGAHTEMIEEVQLLWLEKGSRYQMYHALALLLTGLTLQQRRSGNAAVVAAGWFFLAGIVCFSGSLYLMAFFPFNAGYITPLGGISFMAGWLLLALGGLGGDKKR